VNIIASKHKDNRLIHVYGDNGNGKGDIANFAARYSLEGRVKEIKAAYYIKIEGITTYRKLKDKIFEEIKNHF
jgi:hypothetical protein